MMWHKVEEGGWAAGGAAGRVGGEVEALGVGCSCSSSSPLRCGRPKREHIWSPSSKMELLARPGP